jgi:hypothetical protein
MSIQENDTFTFIIPGEGKGTDSMRALEGICEDGGQAPPFFPCSAGSFWAMGLEEEVAGTQLTHHGPLQAGKP